MKDFGKMILIVFLCSVAAIAQKNVKPRTSIVWSSDATCSTRNSPEVLSAKPNCTSAKIDPMSFYITEYKGITYAMAFQQSQDFIVASVQISNSSGGVVP